MLKTEVGPFLIEECRVGGVGGAAPLVPWTKNINNIIPINYNIKYSMLILTLFW